MGIGLVCQFIGQKSGRSKFVNSLKRVLYGHRRYVTGVPVLPTLTDAKGALGTEAKNAASGGIIGISTSITVRTEPSIKPQ